MRNVIARAPSNVNENNQYHLIVLPQHHNVAKRSKSVPVRTPHNPGRAATVHVTTPLLARRWRGFGPGAQCRSGGTTDSREVVLGGCRRLIADRPDHTG